MTESRLRQQTELWRTAISTDLRTALGNIVSRNDEVLEQLTADIHAVAAEELKAAVTHARGQAEAAAQSELSSVRARLQADFETARAEFDAARTALEAHLAETERDIIAIRGKRDELAASLDEAAKRIAAVEEAHAQTGRMRQVADARLEEEVQRRTMLTMQLDAARQEIVLAKAEAESCRLEAHLSGERVSALEKRLLHLEAQAQSQPSPAKGSSDLVFESLKNSLDELRSVRTDELLSTLIEHLGDSFATVAVFAVRGKGLKLWRRRGGDSASVPPHVSFESESPLARAAKYRTTVTEEAALGAGTAEQGEMPRVNAIALPLLAHGRVMAVVYAQNPSDHPVDRLRIAETIAEVLVGCVNQRLSRTESSIDLESPVETKRSAQAASSASERNDADQYAVSRQARRVKVTDAVEVLIDGVTSTLVDLSALGVQIMSPTALRPNRCVRVALAGESGRLTCEGRVVWAQLESTRAQTSAMYRAGVRFVDVNPGAITTLVSRYLPAETLAIKSA